MMPILRPWCRNTRLDHSAKGTDLFVVFPLLDSPVLFSADEFPFTCLPRVLQVSTPSIAPLVYVCTPRPSVLARFGDHEGADRIELDVETEEGGQIRLLCSRK